MSAGMLASSLGYAALAHKLRRRTWYILSLTGMALGILGFPARRAMKEPHGKLVEESDSPE